MGPTRKRDLTAAVVAVAVVGYLLMLMFYARGFPRITALTGISLLAIAAVEATWGRYVRSKINAGEIGAGMLGWWLGMLGYLLPNPDRIDVAGKDTPGAAIAAASALALTVAALWLQHCCTKPEEPPDDPGGTDD